ncbi:LacI family DNA-binding transcriptional regulator [Catenovulum sediminis]|uniref:LacI family DNA-binding transcriptional regulator n=1 Tax=Catenovulum sediminis TaxID=1740262 RepID=A0ABV1RE71_9ALTE|nr:LacI family DNA-binding transcriptional regulator [Catenovulum sediminis]
MKATINDVAKLAGVSIKTVSRVINNEPRVRADTIEKVKNAAKALNYQPNQSARSLASTKSYVVGFVYDNPNAYYVIDMQHGILDACRKNHYELLIHPIDSKQNNLNDELADMVQQSRVSGLILTPPLSENSALIEQLNNLGIKIVRVLSGSSEESTQTEACVFIDDHQAAFDVTEHLVLQGHKKIAFFGGDEDHGSSNERLNGFIAALKKHQIHINYDWILPGRYSFESGVESCKKVMKLEDKPTAIFACNDEIAAGTLFSARLLGLRVPQDIAIAGFEDNPFSRQTWPKLTTAAQPTGEIASHAAELLFKQLRSMQNKNKESPQSLCFKPELVIRESTDPQLDAATNQG